MKKTREKFNAFPFPVQSVYGGRDLPLVERLRHHQDDEQCIKQWYPTDFPAKDFVRLGSSEEREAERTKQKFDELTGRWIKETGHFSLERQQIANLSFLKIIAMGEKVLPLILTELGRRPMQGWLTALQVISDRDDITSSATSFREAIECWVNWGKDNGYLK
jgi:hypothetical protein